MSLPRPTIVLFDMDGTTVRHVNPRLLGLLEFLDDVAYKIARIFHKEEIFPGDPSFQPSGRKPRLLAHRAIHKFRRRPVERIVEPCPGIYSVLNLFRDHGIPLGIVSNGLGKGYGHDILSKFNLEPYYAFKIFREDILFSKPHPDPILRALKSFKDPLSPGDCVWYIGDRHKDVIAALAARKALPCEIVPFAYGLKAAIAVLEKGLSPEHIIMNYPDFLVKTRRLLA